MAYSFKSFQESLKKNKEHYSGVLQKLNTGRVTPALLDTVFVSSYGSIMPVSQVATINSEGPMTLVISPWDHTLLRDIEQSVKESEFGFSVSVSGSIIRCTAPMLTSERKEEIKKIVHQKHEDARISVRQLREKTLQEIKKMKVDGVLSEDTERSLIKDMQTYVDAANDDLAKITKEKNESITIV
ncbi:MAG: ribosome-recycling factor [Alphaproteobacteria bacterium]|nr:ribosome-recycling factor [Alphaproteobacteria bacterium]